MMPSESGAESLEQPAVQVGTGAASAVATAVASSGGPDLEASSASLGRHQSRLSWPQVKRLDTLLKEPIPIHGRGNRQLPHAERATPADCTGEGDRDRVGAGGWCSAARHLNSAIGLAARETKELEPGLPVRLFLHPAELACQPFWELLIPLGTTHQDPGWEVGRR